MIPAEFLLSYLEKEDAERFAHIRTLCAEDEEKGTALLELFESEAQQTPSVLSGILNQNVTSYKGLMREFEDRHTTGGIKYLDAYHGVETLKKLGTHLLNTNKILTFLVSKEKVLSGKVTNELFPHKVKMAIAQECEEKTSTSSAPSHYFLLNEKFDRKSFRVKDTLHGYFWVYQFSTGKKQYILYSEERLESKDYVIEGCAFEMEDYPLIGSTLRLNALVSLVIVHSHKPRIPVFQNTAEMINAVKNVDREKWMSSLFTHPIEKKCYRQPALFETLMSSFVLSAPYKGWPLQLMIIGKKGTGKSTIQECIWHKFDECQEIVEGGASRVKALVPSFKTNPPSCGAVINARRLCAVDELLRILLGVKAEEREGQLGSLNCLLEWRRRTFGSGNGSINGVMSSKFLAVTNPVWNTSTMERLAEQIDDAFLSRLLVWYLSEEHAQIVRSDEKMRPPAEILPKEVFLGVHDYCQTFTSSYDEDRVKAICEKIKGILSQDGSMQKSLDMFDSRYAHHHADCLLDGIIKTRCLTTQRTQFKAIEEDYAVLQGILETMIVQWGINAQFKGVLR